MAQTQFLVTHSQIVAPPGRPLGLPHHTLPGALSPDVYAQILCEGAAGERLVLTYLRPGTIMPYDNQGRSRHRNRWDAASQSGVAFFPAAAFAGHRRMVERPTRLSAPQLTAEVDEAWPDGIRIFRRTPLVSPILTPVPDLRAWLQQHSAVLQAITWWLDGIGSRDFSVWPATPQPGQLVSQQGLLDAFAQAWKQTGPDLDDPPPILVDFDQDGVFIDEAHAWAMYVAHVAHSLAVEIDRRVPWSLLDLSGDDLRRILSPNSLAGVYPPPDSPVPNTKTYRMTSASIPASPRFAYSFLFTNALIDHRADPVAARQATIANLVAWCRDNMQHYLGLAFRDNMLAIWGYDGFPPVSRVIDGTVSSANPELGTQHYTAGCWGTSDFLQTVLRTVNIAVERVSAGGHTMPHFTTDDLYLSHGDDPYSLLARCTPAFPASKLFIDATTYECWFGPTVTEAGHVANISRRGVEMAVQYLPDYLLHMHYLDKRNGLPPEQGTVFTKVLQSYYGTVTSLPTNFWQRLDDKLAHFPAIPKTSLIPY